MLIKSLVETRQVVVGHVLTQNLPQMGLVDHDQLVHALVPHRSNPALGTSVDIRRTKRGANDRHSGGLEDRIEGRHELGIAVVDEEMEGRVVQWTSRIS